MRHTFHAMRRHSERGAIAVEAAIVLSLLAIFVTFPSLFWAFYFYEYSAAQKAVHDAALYLSTAPKLEMATAGLDGDPVALTLARKIIQREMAWQNPPDLEIVCTYRQANGVEVPKLCSTANNQDYKQTLVQLGVSMSTSYADPYTGSDSGMGISPYAIVPYVGN